MLVLHVSDTHLGAMPHGIISRAIDVYEAFKETVDIALKERVDLYIHTGDLFNTANPPPEAYIVAYRALKRLRDKGVRTVAIAGQHDLPKRYAMSPLSILKDVGALDHVAIDDIQSIRLSLGGGEALFVCVPYGLRHKVQSVPRPNGRAVLMAHLLLRELGIPSSEADISLKLFPLGFRYIALGDYHMKTVLRHTDGTPAVYPGSTEVHRVSEYGEKYVALVDLSGDEAGVGFIKLQSVRPWIILSCREVPKCLNDIVEDSKRIAAGGRKRPLVHVSIINQRTDILSRHLDELVSTGLIEHYILSHQEQDEEVGTGTAAQRYDERIEHLDVKSILRSLLKDERLVTYVLGLIEKPSKHIAEELISYLRDNVDGLKELEKSIKAASKGFAGHGSEAQARRSGSSNAKAFGGV